MPPEGIEIVQRSRLRKNSGSMEFAETKEVSRRSQRELKFVRYILRLEDLTKSVKWRAYVMSGGVPTRLHAQYLPQGKVKLPLRDILSLKRTSCLPPPALYSDSWIARSKYYDGITKRMNFNYPRHWNQWKHWAKWLPWFQRLSFILYWQILRREPLLIFFFIGTKRKFPNEKKIILKESL